MSNTRLTVVYLDTNVFSRPFDDQTQSGIQEEANAFLEIISAIKGKQATLLCSDILAFEVYNILSGAKRTKIENYLNLCSDYVDNSVEVLELGRRIQNDCHIRARDALHIASAILGGARYFLSCDNKIVQRTQGRCYRRLAKSYRGDYFSVMNPVLFAKKLKQGEL